eukprot:COSAG02_NODE_10245_length_1988_cov_1.105347_3_plen_76_part_00
MEPPPAKERKQVRPAAVETMIAKELYNTAPINDQFIDQVRAANVGKLCFLNGYWDFAQQTFVHEMIDTLARVPYM